MKGKIQISKKPVAVSLIALFVVLASVVIFTIPSRPGNNRAIASNKTIAELSGFEPGSTIAYKIRGKESRPVLQSAQTDENGALRIALPTEFHNENDKVTYDFTIKESDKTTALSLRYNNQTGTLSLNGETDSPFTDIEIQTPDNTIDTRTDWAGLFKETGLYMKPDKKSEQPIQVAFYSRNIASDAQPYSSKSIIKVLTAPGGGGPTDDRVNVWTENNCSPFLLSTCYTARVDLQNTATVENYVYALMLMTEQLSAVAMQQMQIIGTFLDAKNQMETQRLHQKLKAEAVKDYHPSEQMCRIGSYMRSMARQDSKVQYDQQALNDILMEKQLNRSDTGNAFGPEEDLKNRLEQYKTTYCDPQDNNAGLDILCEHAGGLGAVDKSRVNKDIDFTRALAYPYTIDVDFTDSTLTEAETDMIALGRNLYWNDVWSQMTADKARNNAEYYMDARQFVALNNIAHNSFTRQVAMKAKAPQPAPNTIPGWAYMKTMLREFGMDDEDIEDMIGQQPSYDAQMAILTKKMYQNPDFYTNLYNKPTNVERTAAAMDTIALMQMRDRYQASLRQEMLMSGMIETELIKKAEILKGRLLDLK